MSTSKNLVKFIVDTQKFIVSKDALDFYPECILTTVVNEVTTCKCVIPSNKTNKDSIIFYVDRDPESFKYVIDYIRGYEIDLDLPYFMENKQLCNKIKSDLKYFNLKNVVNMDVETFVYDDIEGWSDDISNILKEEYTEETPMLKQLINHLVSKDKTSLQTKEIQKEDHDNKLEEMMNLINQNGGTIPFNLIATMSNDETIKRLILEQQKQQQKNIDEESSDFSNDNFSDSSSSSSFDNNRDILHKNKRIYIEID